MKPIHAGMAAAEAELEKLVAERAGAAAPDGYAVVTPSGAFVGIWPDLESAALVANRSPAAKGEMIVPMFFRRPADVAMEVIASRPEARSHVPIKVRPMLVSGMLAKDDRGPVILLDSEQEPEQQVLAFWHEVLHLVGLKDEVRTEETAMILAGACPSILRAVCDNINVPDSGLGMNSGPLTKEKP